MSSNAGVSNLSTLNKPDSQIRDRPQSSGSEILDTTMRVTTPENISFQYQLVGPFRRIFAYLLDILASVFAYGAMVTIAYLAFAFILMPLATAMGGASILSAIGVMAIGLVQIGYFLVYWFYGVYMETYFNGQTIGKRALRMRVISTDGHAIDGVQATLRNFFRLLDTMPFVSFNALFGMDEPGMAFIPTCLFGLLIMMLSPKFQRIGDLVSGTVVVNEERSIIPDLAKFDDERVSQLAELIPKGFVVPHSMAKAIADYVDQRRYLPFQRASEVAGHLAVPLLKRFELAPDTDHDLFLCSLYYKTFVADMSKEDDEPTTPIMMQRPNRPIAGSNRRLGS